jgi:hypothetical protein
VYCGRRVRRNPPHTTVIDPQSFAEHGDFGFKLTDSRVFRVAVLDQSFAPREHRYANDANDIEHRGAYQRVPVFGESQRFGVFFTAFGGHGATGNQPRCQIATSEVRRD